ncbi:MAG: hypothetical protein A4E57_00656 [Syntrophorhabdaceae bacterium PtaU1.Bin034]|nr:MAG: hypothetical protein A4E57_00656 [Syntrophorhabdaceae bacterium PtaU1.Bin034]
MTPGMVGYLLVRCANRFFFLTALIATLLMAPSPTFATPIVKSFYFAIAGGSAGSIFWPGGNTPLTGTDISVTTIKALDENDNLINSWVINDGTLTFTTGNYTGKDLTAWHFGPGGNVALSGSIPGIGIESSVALFSGSFNSVIVTQSGSTFKVVNSSLNDTLYPALAQYFNLDTVSAGNFNIGFRTLSGQTTLFTSTSIQGGDQLSLSVLHTSLPTPFWLLAPGFIVLWASRRRPKHGGVRKDNCLASGYLSI